MNFIQSLVNCNTVKILIIAIITDTLFGILRAIKEKSINSAIGIDGIIRKVGMLITIIFSYLVDYILTINFIAFLPTELKQFLNINSIGIGDLFSILFIIFEFLSILKNMVKCKLPIPAKLQDKLEKIMKEFTSELNNKE